MCGIACLTPVILTHSLFLNVLINVHIFFQATLSSVVNFRPTIVTIICQYDFRAAISAPLCLADRLFKFTRFYCCLNKINGMES